VVLLDSTRCAVLAQQFRVDVIRMTANAGSGHPTSALSIADLIAVLAEAHLRMDTDDPKHPGNDRLILSKGHAAPVLYAMYRAAGVITEQEMLTYRLTGSRLGGHPTPQLPVVDAATGSLGQGLPIGVGLALAAKRLAQPPPRVWVVCGDAEMSEGSNYEALEYAGWAELGNLSLIVDVNRLGCGGPTKHGWELDAYVRRVKAFGWHAITIDGHDLEQIDKAYTEAAAIDSQPTAIIARTVKGKGVSAVEDAADFHGRLIPDPATAIESLGGIKDEKIQLGQVEPRKPRQQWASEVALPSYQRGAKVAVRDAYGDALVALGHRMPDLVVLDAEVAGASRSARFAEAHPKRFLDMHVAEQLMAGVAVGFQRLDHVVVAATFGAFWTRAHDFIRMAAISGANLSLIGSHPGVSIGADGPSQMAMEDLAMVRPLPGSTVLYPSDANQTVKLLDKITNCSGISYLRLTRDVLPVLYEPNDEFDIGGSRTLRVSDGDEVALVAAGITVHQALKAADELVGEGIRARVIDLYSIKPIDTVTLVAAAEATGRILTVEDHHPEGGLGEAVLSALSGAGARYNYAGLAAVGLFGSARPEEQLEAAGIGHRQIADAARRLIGHTAT
jgi:transketolase